MSFLDRIREGTTYDPERYRPWTVDGEVLGRVRWDRVPLLLAFEDVFRRAGSGLAFAEGLDEPSDRTAALARVVEALQAEGRLREDCTEQFAAVRAMGEVPRFLVARCAMTFFGLPALGIHVNGYVEGPEGLRVWVGRRTDRVRVEPFKLDNVVAGGQPAGLDLLENLRKEAWEEAGIPERLARRAVHTGVVTYRYETEEGLRDEVLYTFDLALPRDFQPQNRDGELDRFMLWDVETLKQRLRDTRDFKTNVALVNLDFLIRHGLLDPGAPDYVRIARGLRS